MTAIQIRERSFGTHDGPFHADEVTACALLVWADLIDLNLVIRTREMGRLQTCQYVCDIGCEYDVSRLRFDHHQKEYTGSMSSAGMVLNYLHTNQLVPKELAQFLEQSFVHGVDEWDNGQVTPQWGHTSFSEFIDSYVPDDQRTSDEEMNTAFFVAVDVVLGFIQRLERRFGYLESCKVIVKDAMQMMDECLVFDSAHSWMEPFFALGGETHPAKFVIMPTKESWKLRAIPPTYKRRMEVRVPLPKEWAGLSGKDLQQVSAIEGAIFCHKGLFISGWKTKQDALKALKKILEAANE